MSDRLKVMGVLTGSGAARAGVQQGDELLTIEGQALPQGQNAERQASAILAPLTNGRSSVNLTVGRKGADAQIQVPLTYACAFGIELGNSDNVNAYSDGHRVLVTRGMLGVVASDDELAYVMAREMAHNALAHASQQRISAAMGGIIDNLVLVRPDMSTMVGMAGAKPMPQNLDTAADKLSLYMLARAGYNIDNFPAFWQKLTAKYPASVTTSYTALHPMTPRRVSAMNTAIREVKAKRASGKPLMP
jgi:predicted Zn-dependent protease